MHHARPRIAAVLAVSVSWAAGAASAETLELANGDRLSGEIVRRTARFVELDHPSLGRVRVPVAELASPEPPDTGVLGTGWLVDWDRSLSLGLSGARGNSDTLDLAAGLDLRRKDEERRWRIDVDYFLSRADREITDHQSRTSFVRDWLEPGSPWFRFATGSWDWDEFEDWDHRVSAFGGLGRELAEQDRFALRARFGPGFTWEFGSGEQATPEMLIGIEADWELAEDHTLGLYLRLYPQLTAFGEYRGVSGGEWKLALTDDGLGLKLGVENEYDSEVDRDTEGNDLRYYGTLVYDF